MTHVIAAAGFDPPVRTCSACKAPPSSLLLFVPGLKTPPVTASQTRRFENSKTSRHSVVSMLSSCRTHPGVVLCPSVRSLVVCKPAIRARSIPRSKFRSCRPARDCLRARFWCKACQRRAVNEGTGIASGISIRHPFDVFKRICLVARGTSAGSTLCSTSTNFGHRRQWRSQHTERLKCETSQPSFARCLSPGIPTSSSSTTLPLLVHLRSTNIPKAAATYANATLG